MLDESRRDDQVPRVNIRGPTKLTRVGKRIGGEVRDAKEHHARAQGCVGILVGILVSVSAQLHVKVGVVRTYAQLESDKCVQKIIWPVNEIRAE